MSKYIDQIKKLVELQGIDTEMIKLKDRLVEAPKHLEELQAALDNIEDQVSHVKERLELLNHQKKKLSQDIEDDSNKIKKSKNKLMMVNNTKEYHAMMREMDNLEKLNRFREDEMTNLIEDIQVHQEKMEDLSTQRESLNDELAISQSTLDSEMAKINKRIKALEKNREKACATVPMPILSRYNFIKDRLHNPVIVSVKRGVCTGCYISIPPQSFIEIQKGEQILSCPNCQRLIYWEEHYNANQDEKAET
ncbi:zinc ribbon domain-containing protein [Desulfonatronovibrio magnus]|uniref:zinc ribbon domain-containing protein n=1 Tax=Desulfonatronovibrio magnus TaxID=698827 RepID=UPI0005EAE4F7|nr:C4-type zinc ribbon domain-containing protein [Desulfonatronovibrio magnus]